MYKNYNQDNRLVMANVKVCWYFLYWAHIFKNVFLKILLVIFIFKSSTLI